MIHDQPSVLSLPRVNPWVLMLTMWYALFVVGGAWWISSLPVASNAPASPLERIVGVTVVWVLFCLIPWSLGYFAARASRVQERGSV
jgi:hypothetical protein